ncbi:uncharacterized protein LOC113228841 [Hyposmocoma kahamanoa]|uniref:uncharacterized protein LOC113228841 n=1 Tax=Hyposmocoma kahamanoa TaxID=1477025 RepID=UPI000E6D8D02|nr:uncharacterized protein LOC113228841 [Hyposmocoma kahamanoa]
MAQLTLQDISIHLTEDVVQRAFQLRIGTEDTIQSLQLSPTGAGLIGAVYRIKVKGKDHSANFIAKTLVRDRLLRKSLPSEIFFQREIFFYSKVVPTLEKVQKSSGATETIQSVVPICYAYHCDGISDYILLEDITERNYSSVSVHPTVCECNKILRTLAHLHAVSMGMRIKKPEEFTKLKNSLIELYYTEDRRQLYANYLKRALDLDLKALKKIEDPSNSIYYKKFFEIASNDPYGQLVDLLCNSDHMVFNHGDAWSLNFLCSKDQAIAIDFQLVRCTSPVADLTYFLLLSINSCPTKDKFIEAIRLYYDHFVYYLRDMGVDEKVFSWDDLNSELKKYGKFGLLAASTSIPLLGSSGWCNVLENFEEKYAGVEIIPLEKLWPLGPLSTVHQITNLMNAVRVMVDLELI